MSRLFKMVVVSLLLTATIVSCDESVPTTDDIVVSEEGMNYDLLEVTLVLYTGSARPDTFNLLPAKFPHYRPVDKNTQRAWYREGSSARRYMALSDKGIIRWTSAHAFLLHEDAYERAIRLKP